MNTIRNNNAFENEFWRTHNQYKLTPHIDSKPNYTPPYYAPQETGYGSFNYESFVQNLKKLVPSSTVVWREGSCPGESNPICIPSRRAAGWLG